MKLIRINVIIMPLCVSLLLWHYAGTAAAVTSGKAATGEPAFVNTAMKPPALIDPNIADELISVNFDQADIGLVIKTISEITGINFIVDDNIQGTVTVLSPTQIRLGDLYPFLESILEIKGFAAVPAGNLVKIVLRANAAKHNLNMQVGADPAHIPQNDSILTQLIPLKYADAVEVSSLLRPRLPDGAQLSTYSRTNTIIITGTSSNIHHLARIIQQFDIPNAKETSTIIHLKHASAAVLSKQITDMMARTRSASPGTTRSGRPTHIRTATMVKPDRRTNSLIVTANQQDTETIKDLVRQLDIERPAGTDNVHVVYLEHANATEVAESLMLATSGLNGAGGDGLAVRITPDEGTSSLIINASPQDYAVIEGIIKKLDIVRVMVLVELLIIEVSEENLREIGIDWATLDRAVSDSIRAFGSTNFGIRVNAGSTDVEGLQIGAFKEIGGNVRIGAILRALEKESSVNILSSPQIMTSNHQQARFLVGDNIPFISQSRISEDDPRTPTVIKTIDYKDVGVDITITPHVSQGGLIRLEIESEFTQQVESVTGLSAETPTIAKRRIETEIAMTDGATVVLGGLIRDNKITVEKKVPILGDIPLLGGLFRYKRYSLQKTNLLLFITPHILSTNQDMANITNQKRDEMAPQLEKQLAERNTDKLTSPDSIWR